MNYVRIIVIVVVLIYPLSSLVRAEDSVKYDPDSGVKEKLVFDNPAVVKNGSKDKFYDDSIIRLQLAELENDLNDVKWFYEMLLVIVGLMLAITGYITFSTRSDSKATRVEAKELLVKLEGEIDYHRRQLQLKAEQTSKEFEEILSKDLELFRHRSKILLAINSQHYDDDEIYTAITTLEYTDEPSDYALLKELLKLNPLSEETKSRLNEAIQKLRSSLKR